jgi:hypothetical protein
MGNKTNLDQRNRSFPQPINRCSWAELFSRKPITSVFLARKFPASQSHLYFWPGNFPQANQKKIFRPEIFRKEITNGFFVRKFSARK